MPLDRTAKREIRNLKGLRRESVNPAALSRRPSMEEPLLVEEGHAERAPVSPAHHHHQKTGGGRDGRALWGLARNNLSSIRRQAGGASAEPPQPSSAHRTDAPARVDDDDAYTTSTVIEKLLFNLHAAKSRRSMLSERTLSDTEAGGGEGGGGRVGSEAASVTARAFAPASDARHLLRMLRSSYLNVLLLAIPLAMISGSLKASPVLVFSASFTALLPLALILGEITEDLALRFGDAIGGLLNATFGNAVEMILGLAALFKGLNRVVAASMIGSVLSNLLLVMGCSFLFAGLRYKGSRFNTLANKVSCSLLFLATISIMIPTAARVAYGKDVVTDRTITQLSRAIAAVLLILYCCYLYFQLFTHRDSFNGPSPSPNHGADAPCQTNSAPTAALDTPYSNAGSNPDYDASDLGAGEHVAVREEGEDERHEGGNDGHAHGPALSMVGAVAALALITVIVAVCSEYLTGAIEQVSKVTGVNESFLGLIVLPIAGNAAEHITAVFVAVKGKMDLAISVSLGSCIQIAIFVLPVTVLVGWGSGHEFNLNFDPFDVLMLTVSVILAYFVSSDGSSNWILGLFLVVNYVLIASVYLLEAEPTDGDGPGSFAEQVGLTTGAA